MISRFLLTAALALSLTGALPAAEKKGAATPAPAPTEKAPDPGAAKKADPNRPLPFHGKVSAVDPAAKTFSLKGSTKDRVFQVTDKTNISKEGKPAKLTTLTVGEEVTGSAKKSEETWTAVSVYIGGKNPAGAGKGKAEKGAAKGAATPAAPAAAGEKKAQ
jgi:hypothetical protein